MSKGDKSRPLGISHDEWQRKYDKIFSKKDDVLCVRCGQQYLPEERDADKCFCSTSCRHRAGSD